MKQICLNFTVSLSLALCCPVSWAQDKPMSGQEIQEAWAGKELVGNATTGARFFMRLEKDGSATIAVGNINDTGRWRTADTGYCAAWTQIRKGEERCFTVLRSGSSYKVLNPDGSVNGMVHSVK